MPEIHGRGAAFNPPNRFDAIDVVPDPDTAQDDEQSAPVTQFMRDTTRSIIAYNESPDVGFDASVNPYRGCEHGCIYCFARPFHEFLGFSAGLDFETKILVKEDAPELLRAELASKKWKPQPLAMSGVTDPYQPVERRLRLTRRCLEVLAEFRNPVIIITKNHLVSRDADLLSRLAADQAALVHVSVTTLDDDLAGRMEPRASRPRRRLEAIRMLSEAGVPVKVLIGPVVPGLTDHEIPAIAAACARAGARYASFIPLRLPHAVKDLFVDWLGTHYPHRKEKVLNRIRSIRGGKLNEPGFNKRFEGEGEYMQQMESLFRIALARTGLQRGGPVLSTAAFRKPGVEQLSLFSD